MGSQQTSSTTGTVFIADVRNDYNDTSTGHFDASKMLEFLNDGLVDISVKSQCLEAVESIDLADDTLEYSITTEYVEVKSVHYIDADGKAWALKDGSPSMVSLDISENDTDYPAFWYEFAGKIGAYPVLSSRTTETLNVYLSKRAVPIVAATNLPIPAAYENALKYYMLARMSLVDRDMGRFSTLMNQYLSEIGIMRKDLNEQ